MTESAPIQPGLHLFTSNRLEALADKLAARLRRSLASPLQREIVVVRNKGMERWLKLQLAERLGVCACCEFPFPEAFGQRVFRTVLPQLATEPLLDRETLAWRIAQVLPELKERPDFALVRRYLGGTNELTDERKLIQLSARLANLFDQYLVFRPEMILNWDAGRDAQWQAELWRAVSGAGVSPVSAGVPHAKEGGTGGLNMFTGETPAGTAGTAAPLRRHAAALWKQFESAMLDAGSSLSEIPERVSIFGISALAPFYLGLLEGLSRQRQVNLFLLQPSQEYWGDITSPREEERILRRQFLPDDAAFAIHLEPGNRLLASFGYLGRDFLKLVLAAGDWQCDESFAEPGEDSLLHCIQSDILHLRDRGRVYETGSSPSPPSPLGGERAGVRGEGIDKLPASPSDDSLQIHSCHSPLREMEVLYDRMLDWFDRDPRLAPRDVVVMMPNVETYAPFIQAVFGSPEEESRRIPFNLADRGARRESHIIETFLKLLALPDTRFGSATVLAPLETPALRERFGLSESAFDTIRDYVRDANIRWGIDAAHRERLGLPAFDGQTWRTGLDRLLLGHAMAGHDERLFAGILPLDHIEGEAAALAGSLAEYIERLFELVDALTKPRSLDEWAKLLDSVLDRFFEVSEDSEREFQIIRAQLNALRRQHRDAGFTRTIGRAALLERLGPALDDDLHHAGFLTGGVTFCGFKPMRSIPFKIVCLVGMNDGAFPRTTERLSFDLMAQKPRLGDRSMREDDRYLFLETLLSARDRLYISYVGQSVKDNSPAPPSVLVSELLDYVEQGFTLAGGAPGSDSAAGIVEQPTAVAGPNVQNRPKPLPLPLRGGEGRGEGAPHLSKPLGAATRVLSKQKNERRHRVTARAGVEEDLQLLLLPGEGGEGREEKAARQAPQQQAGPEAGPSAIREHLVIRHHLQAFHEDYFNNTHPRFFSYSSDNCRASVTARDRDARRRVSPFLDRPLVEPGPELRRVTIEELGRFFSNPAKFFLRHRIGMTLAGMHEELDEREPVLLDALGQYRLRADVLQHRLAGQGVSSLQPFARASGELPPGAVGEVDYTQCAAQAETFAARVEAIRLAPQPPCDFDLPVGEFHVTGRIRERTATGPLAFRCGTLRGKDLLRAWLQHLAANCFQRDQTTTLLCQATCSELRPPADAQSELAALLELYWQGLRAPLKFFPESALKFAETERGGITANPALAFSKARIVWNGDKYRDIKGEREEDAFDICFRHEEPLDEEFANHARTIFGAVLDHETRTEA